MENEKLNNGASRAISYISRPASSRTTSADAASIPGPRPGAKSVDAYFEVAKRTLVVIPTIAFSWGSDYWGFGIDWLCFSYTVTIETHQPINPQTP